MVYHCKYNSYLQWLFLLSFLTAMKILLFLHFIYSLCLFFNLIKALAAHFLCPQTTFFGTKLDLLKNKNKSPNIITETITSTDLTVNLNATANTIHCSGAYANNNENLEQRKYFFMF